jgi:phosphocarrier protein HPr
MPNEKKRNHFTICNEKGLHARAATQFVKVASQFESDVTVLRDGARANGKSVMSLLILAAARGSEIEVITSGSDAAEAIEALGALIERGFGE